jgi:hypothetical protein
MFMPYTKEELLDITNTILLTDASDNESSSDHSVEERGAAAAESGHVNQRVLKAELKSDRKIISTLKDQDFRVAFGPKPKPSASMSGEEFKTLKSLTNAASKITLMATSCMEMEVCKKRNCILDILIIILCL